MMNYLLNDHGYVQPDWKHHADVAEWFVANHGNIPEKLEKSTYLNLKGYYYFNFEFSFIYHLRDCTLCSIFSFFLSILRSIDLMLFSL